MSSYESDGCMRPNIIVTNFKGILQRAYLSFPIFQKCILFCIFGRAFQNIFFIIKIKNVWKIRILTDSSNDQRRLGKIKEQGSDIYERLRDNRKKFIAKIMDRLSMKFYHVCIHSTEM